ncbi:chromosome partitioning protein ParB [Vibrio sp. HA2012]|uniref:cytochrome C assembly family protein n=1 Tax=Vibrio sp. HA2012 TaxID=1971595 RepID=UPI000C2B7CD7|nr:inner membrane protein YpjD [Vibrio sp. HA2012]PJC85987.1 chromosome partitioning protein ParB [Vibrio sp. HA2012]
MDNLIAIVSAVFYIAATCMIVPGLMQQTSIRIKPVFTSALLALFFHIWLLADLILHGTGQNLSILNVASLISFMISLSMSLAMLKTRIWFLLPLIYCFSALNILAATLLPGHFITHLEGRAGLVTHISLALIAYATLTIAALYALQLTWLDYKLKRKKTLTINTNHPPLMMVERQLFSIVLLGTGFLTLTLLSGFIFLDDIFAPGKAHKTILSFVAWVVFSILLWGHYRHGWRGRLVAWFTVSGATLLTMAYFGNRLLQEIILS